MESQTVPEETCRRPRRRRRIALLAILAVVVGLVGLLTLGAQLLRDPLAGVLSTTLDRHVSISGDMALGWNGGPTLQASGITVASPDATTEPAISIGVLDVGVRFAPLLRGEIDLTRVVVSDARLRPQDLATRASTKSDEPGEAVPGWATMLARGVSFALNNVTFILIDAKGAELTLLIPNLMAEADPETDITAHGRVVLDGTEFAFSLDGASAEALTEGKPFAFDFKVNGDAGEITVDGSATGAFVAPALNARVEAKGDDLEDLLTLAGVDAGLHEAFELATTVQFANDVLDATDIVVALGDLDATGALTFDLSSKSQVLTGELALSELSKGQSSASNEIDLADLLDTTVPFHLLETIALDLDISLERHRLGPIALHGINLPVRLADGELTLSPISALVDGEPLRAHLLAEIETGVVDFQLEGDTVPLTTVLKDVRPDLSLEGTASNLKLDVQATGYVLRDLMASLEFDLSAQSLLVTNTYKDGSTIELDLQDFTAFAGAGRSVTISASGTLDDEFAALSFTSGSLRDLVAGTDPWPIEAHFGREERGLQFAGVLLDPVNLAGLLVESTVAAGDIQHIAEFLAIDLPLQGTADAYLHIKQTENGASIDWVELEIGPSQASGRLEIALIDDLVRITGDLESENIQIKPQGGKSDLDETILRMGEFDGFEMDIAVDIRRLKGKSTKLSNLVGNLVIADNVLSLTNATGSLFRTPAQISMSLDSSQSPPVMTLDMAMDNVDPANIGNDFGMQGLMTGTIGHMSLSARTEGHTLREMADSADVAFQADEGSLQLGSGATALEFVSLRLDVDPGQAAHGTEHIVLAGIPIRLELEFVSLLELISVPSPWTLYASSDLLDLNFSVSREVTASLEIYAQPVTMHMTSDDLRVALGELDIELPYPLPLTTTGTVQVFPDKVTFDLTEARVANSDVSGSLIVGLVDTPRTVDADFVSNLLSLDDVISKSEEEEIGTEPELDIEAILATRIPPWTVPDAEIDIQLKAEAIRWDGTEMSTVTTHIATRKGFLIIDDMTARVFGGLVSGAILLEPVGDDTYVQASLDIDEIDSDAVYRFAGIADAAEGELELETRIKGQGGDARGLLASLDGTLVLERGEGWIRSNMIDFLNEDLFSALFGSASQTPIKCTRIAVDLNSGQGEIEDSRIVFQDVVLVINGALDLDNLSIDTNIVPESLSGTFLRLLPAIVVDGSLLDPVVEPEDGVVASIGDALFGAGPSYDGDIDKLCVSRVVD